MNTLGDYLDAYGIELTDDAGEEVSRPKGLYTHTGIIMGMNKWTKIKQIFHNHPDDGRPCITLDFGISFGLLNLDLFLNH